MSDLERRVSRLEDWRDKVDEERGAIMAELSALKTTLSIIQPQLTIIGKQVQEIYDAMADRPSHADLKELESDIKSIRAKAKVPLSELEVLGPMGWKFKLLGFSGITVVAVLTLAVAGIVFWILK